MPGSILPCIKHCLDKMEDLKKRLDVEYQKIKTKSESMAQLSKNLDKVNSKIFWGKYPTTFEFVCNNRSVHVKKHIKNYVIICTFVQTDNIKCG